MTSTRGISFLLFLLLHTAYSEEPEPVFRPEGGVIVMGYCFGVDYIVIYRSAPEGDQLLGNSSADATPPADLRGRVSITNNQHLLGLQISHLKHSDSGAYRRECWQNKTLVNQHRQQLSVCNEEVHAEEIAVQEDGGAELRCNSSSAGLEGTTIRWYYEVAPSYKATLLLDSSASLEPLLEGLQGVVEVRDGGALLHVPSTMLKDSQSFHCLVMKGLDCLSFQNIYLLESSMLDVRDIFASQGDRVVLNCPSDHKFQKWETPLGTINTTAESLTSTDGSTKSDEMYISGDDESENYSLVIPAISDSHSGEYLCFSASDVVQYFLVLCPRGEPRKKSFFEGGNVSLECEVTGEEFHSVQWHRRGNLGEDSLIQDSKDKSKPVPEDLRGRVILSERDSKLTLSGLTMKDAAPYWCVVLGGPEFLEGDDEYLDKEDDYDEEGEYNDSLECISKQETVLTVAGKGRTLDPEPGDLVTSPTPDPPADSNLTVYALVAGLAVVLVAGAIAAVIAIKKRTRTSKKQRGAAAGSGLTANKAVEMNVDPSCTERLNPSDEYHA